jgi:hypothetical protein|tara:strand:+ start:1101 stop:1505 length:405 start_codon:yes stop_codon:yes gene_type:complete
LFYRNTLYGEEKSGHSNETCGVFVDDGYYNCLIVDESDIHLEESSPLGISFTNFLSITGFQFYLVVDTLIVSIDSVIATDRLDGFGIAFNQYDDGKIVIIGYSLTSAEVDPGEGPIVDVYFTGDTLGMSTMMVR